MSFFKRETPHNPYGYAGLLLSYYTIPRNNRELQQHNGTYAETTGSIWSGMATASANGLSGLHKYVHCGQCNTGLQTRGTTDL